MGIHPAWHVVTDSEIDLRERVLSRPRQRAYLARYGRQDYFRHDMTIPELDAAVRNVSDVVSRENEASSIGEDH